jgi:hypothetical protein
MLPTNLGETGLVSKTSERQTNYLILRTLESKLDPNSFHELLNLVSRFLIKILRFPTNWTCPNIRPGTVARSPGDMMS